MKRIRLTDCAKGRSRPKKTVWQLVQEARSLSLDPTSAISDLICKYENRIRTLAKMALSRGMNEGFDELMQRGILGLLLAINRFDRKRGVRFYTYASWRIKNLMLKRDPLSSRSISLDESDRDGGCPLNEVIPSEDSDPSREAELGELWRLAERLPRKQRVVLLLRYKMGLTQAEAGIEMGITKQAVQQFEAKAIANMRKLLNGKDA
jgi:RNA polymerase sigma factor (sigma-70 family)